MVSGVKVSNRQREVCLSTQKFESRQNLNRSKIANSEDMQIGIMQAAIQAATAHIRAIREADPPAEPHSRRNIPEDNCRL